MFFVVFCYLLEKIVEKSLNAIFTNQMTLLHIGGRGSVFKGSARAKGVVVPPIGAWARAESRPQSVDSLLEFHEDVLFQTPLGCGHIGA